MQLKTHEELLQHIEETVIFTHINGERASNDVGMLFLDTQDSEAIYLLNNSLNGRVPCSDEWEQYGYKYSWIISHPLTPHEEDNHDIISICTISIDYNKLEEIL